MDPITEAEEIVATEAWRTVAEREGALAALASMAVELLTGPDGDWPTELPGKPA